MEVGSGVATNRTSELAKTKSITESEIPAPVSIITTSAILSNSYIIRTRLCIWSLFKFVSSRKPEPPEINPIFSGPGETTSRRAFPWNIKSARLYSGRMPSITSTFARPKSASRTTTLLSSLLN